MVEYFDSENRLQVEFEDKTRRTKAKNRARRRNRESMRNARNRNKILVPALTNRVGQHYVSGATIAEIGEMLDMSEHTVRKHLEKYNEIMLEVGEDMRSLHEKHKKEFYPLWKQATVQNLAEAKERTVLAIGESMQYVPAKETDPEEFLKGQAPMALVLELVNKMLEHPVMGPQLIQHVQIKAAVMTAEDAEVEEVMQIESAAKCND